MRRIRWSIPLLMGLLIGACGRDEPTAPGFHTLTGHVTLTGYLVTPGGDFAGTRVVGDADGLPVELVFGSQVVARTLTTHGVYTFHGLAPGAYVARTAGAEPLYDETNALTIVHSDLAAADTLHLKAMGDLFPVPNPIGSHTVIYFYVDDTLLVDIQVDDLAGNHLRHVVNRFRFVPGLQAAGWDGRDDDGRRTPASIYWLKFLGLHEPDTLGLRDERIHLLFR
jgi:hypothetical protein